MNELININEYPVKDMLDLLLKDKTTKQNIIFATDNYSAFGDDYSEQSQMTSEKLLSVDSCEIQPRVFKSLEAQKLRTRVKAEVMTPGWVVCKMNDYADEEWFGRPNVFVMLEGTTWSPTGDPIEFPEGKTWKEYVDSRRIEITCGEAPYIVSRYDVTTGEIIPLNRRIGLLDRKFRIVNENTESEEEWLKWAVRAIQSVYGYEWQGDNLLIARINILNTFVDYMEARIGRKPTKTELRKIANIIAWNFWQMDGFSGTIPYAEPESEEADQFAFDGFFEDIVDDKPRNVQPICLIRDWRKCKGGEARKYTDLKK